MKQAGIEQADFAGPNIFLVIDSEEPGARIQKMCGLILPRIVLIDYSHSHMRKSLWSDKLDTCPENSDMEFWSKHLFKDIAGWVPGQWTDNKIQQ